MEGIRRRFNAKSVIVKLENNVEELLKEDNNGWSIQTFEPRKTYMVVLSEGAGLARLLL